MRKNPKPYDPSPPSPPVRVHAAGIRRHGVGLGHMLVADVARARLTREAREKLDAMARQIEFPGRSYDAITLACWMDDIKTGEEDVPFHGQFKPWHYIDIGISPGDPRPSFAVTNLTDESSGNVVQALKRAVAVIRGGTDPLIPNEAVAYGMIMHLVGDIHQPLHCATYYYPTPEADGRPDTDAGGNRVTVTDSDATPGRMGPRKLNLHAFWDEAYRAYFRDGEVQLDQVPYGQSHVDSEIDPYKFNYAAYAPGPNTSLKTDFDAWALESNQLARDDIYVQLTFNNAHRKVNLSADYVQRSRELAKKRLVLAGYRLAELINNLVAAPPATATGLRASASPPTSPVAK
jgi:hypothetical protein